MSRFRVTIRYDGGLFSVWGNAHRDSGGIAIDDVTEAVLIDEKGTPIKLPEFLLDHVTKHIGEDAQADDEIHKALAISGQPED